MKSNGKWIATLGLILIIGIAPDASAQDTSPPPNNSTDNDSAPSEATLGTVSERQDEAGTAQDEPEQEMLGTGTVNEPAGDGVKGERDPEEVINDPGLDEPRQPIRPGQMEQQEEHAEDGQADRAGPSEAGR